jgi:phosphotransferase system enzyme I (PtsP)
MPYNMTATRVLMNNLRQVMAEDGDTRSRLDHVVRLIAGAMVADVCSVYLREADGAHLLIATEGLKPEAVNKTRMSPGEGLVGYVARTAEPIAIEDAPRHPAFSYRPETGEDPFHAFLGVPILRTGGVTGVLVVQNRTAATAKKRSIRCRLSRWCWRRSCIRWCLRPRRSRATNGGPGPATPPET